MSARSWWVLGLVLAVVAGMCAVLYVRTHKYGQQAVIATGYVAHVVCSCRYLGNRDMASCKTDFEPGMEIVRVSEDAAARRITATVPLLSRQSASFSPEYGCTLER